MLQRAPSIGEIATQSFGLVNFLLCCSFHRTAFPFPRRRWCHRSSCCTAACSSVQNFADAARLLLWFSLALLRLFLLLLYFFPIRFPRRQEQGRQNPKNWETLRDLLDLLAELNFQKKRTNSFPFMSILSVAKDFCFVLSAEIDLEREEQSFKVEQKMATL